MKSTEIHPVSEPKEQEDKKSAVLAANSVSGFRKQPGKKESSLDYKNTDRIQNILEGRALIFGDDAVLGDGNQGSPQGVDIF